MQRPANIQDALQLPNCVRGQFLAGKSTTAREMQVRHSILMNLPIGELPPTPTICVADLLHPPAMILSNPTGSPIATMKETN